MLKEIFMEMSKQTKLKSLSCSFREKLFLDNIPPKILAKAINNLESVRFDSEVNINEEAMVEIFCQMSEETKLKKIFFLPAYILGKGINRLDTFEAPKLLFSTAHLESILGGLKLETSKLKRIHLGKGKISTDSGH